MPKADFSNLPARDPQEVGRQPKGLPPVPHLSNRTVLMRSIGGGCGQLKERRKLRSYLELRDRVEVLEGVRERIGQAPHCSRSELFDLRVEVLIVNAPGQRFRGVKFALYECRVDDQFRCRVRKAFPSTPRFVSSSALMSPAYG